MPLYEYQCRVCGTRFERIQKFSDPPASECPKCGGEVEKLLSSPAIQFKGAGWYVTDYARKSSGAEKSEGKGDTSESKSSGDKTASDTSAKTETKTKTKTETKASSDTKPS